MIGCVSRLCATYVLSALTTPPAVVVVGLLIYRSTKEIQREAPETGEKSFWYENPATGPSA